MFFIVPYLNFKSSTRVSYKTIINSKTIFEGHNVIRENTSIGNSKIGYGTYIDSNSNLDNSKIGRFCSIANNVTVIKYTHPTKNNVSTHPAFFSVLKQAGFSYVNENLFEEELFWNRIDKVTVKIGNDVWIGCHAIIMGGVEIGDGAIIAAGAIVTKDVLPYSIVGGVPAKPIKKRFSENEINFLLEYKWWNKPFEWISQNAKYFQDINQFIKLQ